MSYLMNKGKTKDKGRHGRLAEVHVAKRIGGKTTIGSGNLDGDKGDIKVEDFLMEVKTTNTASLVLHRQWLLKIYQEALEKNKKPALAINFVDDNGKSERRERWVAIPEWLWVELFLPERE